jgi:hypothetical protein
MRWRGAKPSTATAVIMTILLSRSRTIQANVIHLNQTTFLHLGKSGGGAVSERLEEWEVAVGKQCHPRPCPVRLSRPNTTFLIDIRDPVDRYFSAFKWRKLVLCNPLNRTKTPAVGEKVMLDPQKYCQPRARNESIMIHEKYQANASLLAEALCETGEAGEEAQRDFKRLSHAKDCLSDWLPNNTWRTANLISVVLEPGFNYLHQLDNAIEWLVSDLLGANIASELAATKHTELLHQTTDQVRMHSSALHSKHKEPLSPLGSCCVARHLKKDYKLLHKLRSVSCKGKLSNVCEAAFASILQRRQPLLDDSVSCADFVELQNVPPEDTSTSKKPRHKKLAGNVLFDDELFWILVAVAAVLLYTCRKCYVLFA